MVICKGESEWLHVQVSQSGYMYKWIVYTCIYTGEWLTYIHMGGYICTGTCKWFTCSYICTYGWLYVKVCGYMFRWVVVCTVAHMQSYVMHHTVTGVTVSNYGHFFIYLFVFCVFVATSQRRMG